MPVSTHSTPVVESHGTNADSASWEEGVVRRTPPSVVLPTSQRTLTDGQAPPLGGDRTCSPIAQRGSLGVIALAVPGTFECMGEMDGEASPTFEVALDEVMREDEKILRLLEEL